MTLISAAAAGAADESQHPVPDIDLNEIKRRLTEWRFSFVNVRVVWEVRSLPQTDVGVDEWPPPPDPATARLSSRHEWI